MSQTNSHQVTCHLYHLGLLLCTSLTASLSSHLHRAPSVKFSRMSTSRTALPLNASQRVAVPGLSSVDIPGRPQWHPPGLIVALPCQVISFPSYPTHHIGGSFLGLAVVLVSPSFPKLHGVHPVIGRVIRQRGRGGGCSETDLHHADCTCLQVCSGWDPFLHTNGPTHEP